ncbi:ADP-ribose pyrophosphatase, mitochondrial [Anabrus simplex]|uniref:ADP-ribose pyrophosphatase, mitochondrial n=1 Tax=Anabrus simplex TaxID=316456 RepID=UPI0035A2DD95
MSTVRLMKMIHRKCRSAFYPRTNDTIARIQISDNQVPWTVECPDYKPTCYTSPHILGQPWADPRIDDPNFQPKWNSIDGSINRKSHTGEYTIKERRPLNPVGRTGLAGRGILGRWGPNHAADPIVTRWKRNNISDPELHPESNKAILQFVAIQRRDTGEWAIPGGMVDPGEVVTATLKREFLEEALNSLEKQPEQLAESKELVNNFFSTGEVVYKGYVDDPRNTDNAWMETVAMNFHDESGTSVGALQLCAGDDAVNVRWMDISKDLPLYASHSDMILKVAEKHNAHW